MQAPGTTNEAFEALKIVRNELKQNMYQKKQKSLVTMRLAFTL